MERLYRGLDALRRSRPRPCPIQLSPPPDRRLTRRSVECGRCRLRRSCRLPPSGKHLPRARRLLLQGLRRQGPDGSPPLRGILHDHHQGTDQDQYNHRYPNEYIDRSTDLHHDEHHEFDNIDDIDNVHKHDHRDDIDHDDDGANNLDVHHRGADDVHHHKFDIDNERARLRQDGLRRRNVPWR
jgi:hypothetical protein